MKEVFKRDSWIVKKNHRPVTILFSVSKIYETSLSKHVEECLCFQVLLSKYQYGFWKGYSVVNVLLAMIENDECGAFGALLIHLSLVLIAKFYVYGKILPLKLLYSYLKLNENKEWN